MQHDRDTLRHFVLWAKGHYCTSLDKVIAEISGIPIDAVTIQNKIYWLRETCKEYDIDGYDIINSFIRFSDNEIYGYSDGIEQLTGALKSELKLMVCRELVDEEWITIHDLGLPDLFEEEEE